MGPHADGNECPLGFQHLLTFLVRHAYAYAVGARLHSLYAGRGEQLHPAPLEGSLHLFADSLILQRQRARKHLHDRDLSAVGAPDVGELHPDWPRPDDDRRARQIAQHDGLPVGDHSLAIWGDAGDGSGRAARGDDCIASLQRTRAAFVQRHLDRVG